MQRLPAEWRVRDGWTKYLVRNASEAALGREVAWHSGKAHVGMALTAGIVTDAAPYLLRQVLAQRERLADLLHAREIANAIAFLRAPDAGGNADVALQVSVMACWLQKLNAKADPAAIHLVR